MKKLVALLVLCVLFFACTVAYADTDFSALTDAELEELISAAQAELNSRKASSDAAALESDGMVTVREAGFQVKNGKWLYYSFVAHNNLNDKAIKYPEFKIVVRDAEGSLISSDSQVLNTVYPGQDVMYGGMGSKVEGEEPASIEIEFVEPGDDWHIVDPSKTDYPGYIPIEVDSARLKKGGNIVGEFTNPNTFDIDRVAVTVLFRDNDGNLLSGDTTFVNGVKAGKSTAFEIRVDEDLATENYEVFVQPW